MWVELLFNRYIYIYSCGKTAHSPKYVPVERMPPTSRATYFPFLWVYVQVSTRHHLQSIILKYGRIRLQGEQ